MSDTHSPLNVGPVLDVRCVTKSYGDVTVLHEISFAVQPGQRVALMGPSGSGKTTLLNCLGGVDRPTTGSIVVQERRLETMTRAQLAQFRREQVGTIFQFFHLLPTLTAYENIELPLQLLGVLEAERRVRVNDLLHRVGIASRRTALPGELSGGEMQRVAIARALAHRPQLVLADEPTGNLDSANGAKVLQLLREMSEESGTTLILVTHSSEATQICHRIVHLRDGRMVSEETRPK